MRPTNIKASGSNKNNKGLIESQGKKNGTLPEGTSHSVLFNSKRHPFHSHSANNSQRGSLLLSDSEPEEPLNATEFEFHLHDETDSIFSEYEHESVKEAEELIHEKKDSLRRKSLISLDQFQEERVVLNVGGTRFETFKTTLLKFPDSLLGTMLSARNSSLLKLDEHKELFFDRDPQAFACILNFYRTGKLRLFSGVTADVLEEEAIFWQLPTTSISDEKFGDKLALISMGVLRKKSAENLKKIKSYIFSVLIQSAKNGLQSCSIEFKSQDPSHKEYYTFLSNFSCRELLLHDLLQKNVDVSFNDITTSGQGHSYILLLTLWNRYRRLSADRNPHTALGKILEEIREGVEVKTNKNDHILTVKTLYN